MRTRRAASARRPPTSARRCWPRRAARRTRSSRVPSASRTRAASRASPRRGPRSSGCATQAVAEIDAERQRALAEVRGQVADLALVAAGKVVGETMTGERERRLVDEFLAQAHGARRNVRDAQLGGRTRMALRRSTARRYAEAAFEIAERDDTVEAWLAALDTRPRTALGRAGRRAHPRQIPRVAVRGTRRSVLDRLLGESACQRSAQPGAAARPARSHRACCREVAASSGGSTTRAEGIVDGHRDQRRAARRRRGAALSQSG